MVSFQSFYRSTNYIFGELIWIASEEVVLQLISIKCIPVLLHSLEACPFTKANLPAIDFFANSFVMKLLEIFIHHQKW